MHVMSDMRGSAAVPTYDATTKVYMPPAGAKMADFVVAAQGNLMKATGV